MADLKKIGLLVGREWSFPPAFIEEVNGRDVGVIAEYVKLGGTRINEPVEYSVIVDRISHAIPQYRAYLKNAVLQGAYVINNPFRVSADDRFFESSLTDALGMPTPRMIALPMKNYPEGVGSESLRNLVYPLDWAGIVEHVGLPALLRGMGNDRGQSQIVHSIRELIHAYDMTGERCMVIQEVIAGDPCVRCTCVGQEKILPIAMDPDTGRLGEEADLSPALAARLIDQVRTLNQVLGYDMMSVDFAVRDDVLYVIDIVNTAPDMDINRLTPRYFDWAVRAMADFCIEMVLNPLPQRATHYWSRTLPSR